MFFTYFVLLLALIMAHAIKKTYMNKSPLRLGMNLDASGFFPSGKTMARYLDLKNRPPPVKLPRRRMELAFAVQLMRTSYNAFDSMDFSPTDIFQKNQFLFRQNEWELWRKDHPNCIQGDLASPEYFDFISWVQFSTLTFCMKEASTEPFIEVVGAEAMSQKIDPFPMLDSREKIQAVHTAITGDGILDYILSRYPANIMPKGVPISGSTETLPGGRVVKCKPSKSVEEFITAANLIMDVFCINSFAIDSKVAEVPTSGKGTRLISLEMTAPANLWSQQALKLRKDANNDFPAMVLTALARRCGLTLGTPVSTNLTSNNIGLLSVLPVKEEEDAAFNSLLDSVYKARAARTSVRDSPIVSTVKEGESPLPPQVQAQSPL